MEGIEVETVSGEGDLFQVYVSCADQIWRRTYARDDNMEICVDYLENENLEKSQRFSATTELLRKQFQMMVDGDFSVSQLIEMKSQKTSRDGVADAATQVGRSRAMFGLQGVKLHEMVPCVRVISGQTTRYEWQQFLVKHNFQDPLLSVRERLLIDIGWYMDKLYSALAGRDHSLIAVMAQSMFTEHAQRLNDVRKTLKSIAKSKLGGVPVCHTADLEKLPKSIKKQRVNLDVYTPFDFPKDSLCLIGSVFNDTASHITHYFISSDKAYTPEAISACEVIASFNAY